jgi:nicotinamide riboside transporter PnuC
MNLLWATMIVTCFLLACVVLLGLYEWQERRSERKEMEERVRALRWRL